MNLEFDYRAVLSSDLSGEITSLIAQEMIMDSPLRTVIWSVPRQAWVFAPRPAAMFLYDDRYLDRTKEVDRSTAEQIAREILRSELPAEQTLHAMCEEGLRMGWENGPPE